LFHSPSWVHLLCSPCAAVDLIRHHPHLPVLPIIRTFKIAHTLFMGVQHFHTCCFRLSSCQSPIFSDSQIFLLLFDRCFCVFNALCCDSSPTIHTFRDPFLLLFVAYAEYLWPFLHCKLLF
jgi:hypothetical protein